MPHLQKNKDIRQTNQIDVSFSREPAEEQQIDFHLELINKIDKLIKKHESGTSSEESESQNQQSSFPQEPPVELRTPLSKPIEPSELILETETIATQEITPTPPEFKSDIPLNKNPAFRFVTTLDSPEDMFQEKDTENERIEIIDLSSFMVDDTTPQTSSASIRKQEQTKSGSKKKTDSHKKQSKKVEIIDSGTFKKDQSEQVFITAMKQSKENEEKAKLYYLKSSKHQKATTGKSKGHDSYIPVSFEDKMKQIQEKQRGIEQERQLREQKEMERQLKEEQKRIEKEQREREIEQKKLAELEAKKAELEEKEKCKKEQEEKKRLEEEQKLSEKEIQQKERELKKQQLLETKQAKKEAKQKEQLAKQAVKEQKKQQLLVAKLAKKESIQREQEAKQALKEEKKQQLLEAKLAKKESIQREQEAKQVLKEERKRTAEEQEQLKIMELKKKEEQKKEEHEEVPEMPILDEDIRKFITITDNLLAELPDEVIDRFAKSKDFEIYERIIAKYKIK